MRLDSPDSLAQALASRRPVLSSLLNSIFREDGRLGSVNPKTRDAKVMMMTLFKALISSRLEYCCVQISMFKACKIKDGRLDSANL